jgi:ankyrin repeat protein
MLLNYNAQILKSNDETLIHNLVKMQKYDEIKYLHEFLGSGKVEEILGPNLCNPLLYSVFKEDYKMTKYLISKGYSVNVSNEMGLTPLMRAVEKGNILLVKLLVDNGANVNFINKRNENAFLIACKHNNLKIIKYLQDLNENINFQDDALYTPLMWASMYKYDNVCDFLIENGADHLLKNKYNKTAMVLADEVGNKYFKKEVWIY